MDECKGCGKPIIWGVTSPGKAVPLDPAPPVYHVVADSASKSGFSAIRLARENHMVSHFATCTHANDFSGSKKSEPELFAEKGGGERTPDLL